MNGTTTTLIPVRGKSENCQRPRGSPRRRSQTGSKTGGRETGRQKAPGNFLKFSSILTKKSSKKRSNFSPNGPDGDVKDDLDSADEAEGKKIDTEEVSPTTK